MTVADVWRLRELEGENAKSWSMDYVADGLIDGRKRRVLAIVGKESARRVRTGRRSSAS
jgi:hypothetical protein